MEYREKITTIIIEDLEMLRESIIGRRDCIILISKKCSHDIDELPYYNYKMLKEEIKLRNIILEVSDK